MAVASRVPERTRARLSVKGRSRWRARPRRGNILRMRNVSRITVHHAAGKPNWTISERDVADSIRKIQRYHQTENGWADIGYHYVIDRAGRVWQGREIKWQGAHAGGSAKVLEIIVFGLECRAIDAERRSGMHCRDQEEEKQQVANAD